MKRMFLFLVLFSPNLNLWAVECKEFSLGVKIFEFVVKHQEVLSDKDNRKDFVSALETLKNQVNCLSLPGHTYHGHFSINSKLSEEAVKLLSSEFYSINEENIEFGCKEYSNESNIQDKCNLEVIETFLKILGAITFYPDGYFGVSEKDPSVSMAYRRFQQTSSNDIPVKSKKSCIIS